MRHEKSEPTNTMGCVWLCCFKDLKAFLRDFCGARVEPESGWADPEGDKTAYLSPTFVKMTATTDSARVNLVEFKACAVFAEPTEQIWYTLTL